MLYFSIKQYKTSNTSLKQRQMEKIVSKKKGQNYERKQMALPNKTFLKAKFSNERLNDALKLSNISASFGHKSPEAKHQKTFSANFQAKFDKTQHSRLSFVDYVSTKNAFRKILRLNTMKGQKSIGNKTMIRRKSPKAKTQKPLMTQIDEYTSQIRKCMQLSTKQAMRKSYHQKFGKTRLIFQQEEKMKKIDKINKIYQRKNAIFNKMNRSEDIKELMKARQESIAQKWAKRYEKHEIYQISENGQEYERSI